MVKIDKELMVLRVVLFLSLFLFTEQQLKIRKKRFLAAAVRSLFFYWLLTCSTNLPISL